MAAYRVGSAAIRLVIRQAAAQHPHICQIERSQVALVDELAHVLDVRTVDISTDDGLNGLLRERVGQRAGTAERHFLSARTGKGNLMQRAIKVERVDGKVALHAGGDAELLVVGGIAQLVVRPKHQEAHAARASEGIERVGLQIGVAGWGGRAVQEVGELPQLTALPHKFRLAALLSGRGQETIGEHIVGAVLHEEYLAILLGVLGYLGQCAVDVALANGHGVGAVVFDRQIGDGLEESPCREEVGEVLAGYLAHLADELQRAVGGAAP